MRLSAALAGALLIGTAGRFSHATVIVPVSTYSVSQGHSISVPLTVSDTNLAATDDIEGMTLTVQLVDGTGATPSITAIDLLTGTIWAGKTNTVYTPTGGNLPQFQSRFLLVDAPGDYVNANGTLATLTFNAGVAAAGDYSILLTGTFEQSSDSDFLNGGGDTVPATFGQGVLHVTSSAPEPASLASASAAGILLLRKRRAAVR